MIIATRNRLIDAYLGIDNDTLWSIVITDVPRQPMKAHAIEAARRVARVATSRGLDRKLLSRQRFSIRAPRYDIVLM